MAIYLLQGNVKWRPRSVKAIEEAELTDLGRKFYECETASWRKMLLTQPPVRDVVVYAVQSGSGKGTEELLDARVPVKDERGVTMGMILEASETARRRDLGVKRNDSGYVSILIEEEEVLGVC